MACRASRARELENQDEHEEQDAQMATSGFEDIFDSDRAGLREIVRRQSVRSE